MAVPPYQEFMLPLLRLAVVADCDPAAVRRWLREFPNM